MTTKTQTDFLKYLREKFPNDKIIKSSFPKGNAPELTDTIREYTDLYQQYCVGYIFNITRNEEFYFDEGERPEYSYFLMCYSPNGNFGFSFGKTSPAGIMIDRYEKTDKTKFGIESLTDEKDEYNLIQKLY